MYFLTGQDHSTVSRKSARVFCECFCELSCEFFVGIRSGREQTTHDRITPDHPRKDGRDERLRPALYPVRKGGLVITLRLVLDRPLREIARSRLSSPLCRTYSLTDTNVQERGLRHATLTSHRTRFHCPCLAGANRAYPPSGRPCWRPASSPGSQPWLGALQPERLQPLLG